ncbi:MAG: SDR family oxidoreductase [Sandaracinus sp.]|nr:SDR family oxidoreductase [Sandaracinus sp.]
MGKLNGRVAWISGATSGIGRAAAVELAREGATVAIVGRRAEAGEETLAEVKAAGGRGFVVTADVTRSDEVKNAIETTLRQADRLDVVLHAAGTLGRPGPVVEQDEASWNDVIETNLSSAFHVARHAFPALAARGGSLIFVGSVAGYGVAFPGVALYGASKAGLVGFAEALAHEGAPQGVRVNVLVPGPVDTPMFRSTMGATEEAAAGMAQRTSLGRVARPEELAKAVLFLASDDSSFVTGAKLVVDGGLIVK